MAKPTLPDLRSPIKEFARTEKMLHAVRDLNHLIIKEKDMNRLLSKACDLLVESCGYYNAMIILLDDGKPLEPFFRAGFGGNFTSMASFLRKGSLPDCAENSLRASGLITINDLPSHCTNCPLAPKYNGRAGMAMRLEQAGRIFGWVNVSISRELSKNDDEKALFTDLVDNIAFAIWSLENAIQRERLEKKYAAVIETSPNTVHEFDTEGRITIYENAPQAYQSLDENGCILDVNPAWLKAMGYEREQVIGKPYSAFLHPDWRPHFEKHFPEFKRRGYIHDLNFKLRHKKGHYIDVSFEGCASYHPDGRFRQTNCVFKDITRQKRTEEALRKSRRQVATLMGNLPGMAYRCRYMASRPMMFVSEGCEELTGYSSQDLMPGGTVTYGDLIHPEDRASVWNSVQAAAADEAQFTIEYRIMDKSGRERWVWERGRVVDVDTDGTDIIEGFISDITVRKKIETDLEWNVRRNKILSNIAARLLRSDDPQRLVDNLCRQVMDFLGCDIYFNFLVDPLTEQLRLNASAGIPADEAHALGWRDYGAAVCARVTRNINRIVHEDILHTEGSDNDFLKSQGIQVCCCFPLRIQDRLIGTLSFGNRARPGFSDAEIDLMAAVADLVAVAMHRIETENSLRESERKFRDIFDGTSDAVYIHDMSGNIFEANAASSSQLGYSREKILCMTPADIEFEADNKRVQERIQAIRRKEDLVFESVHRREDGRTFPVEVHSRIIDFEGQQCILSVVRDISERLTLESKIREEEAKFLAFMKYLPGFAYIKDADRKHLFVNESMETLFGKPKEQWIGRRFEEVVQIPEAQEIKNNDEALLFNREPIIVEERIQINKDEQFFLTVKFPIFRHDGNVFLGGVSLDISGLKQAEIAEKKAQQQLIERNQFIETILDNLPIGLAVNYIDSGTTTYMNKAFEAVYGWPKAELEDVTQFFENVYPDPEYRQRLKKMILADTRSGDPEKMAWDNIPITTKNGERRIVYAKNIPLDEQNLMISTVQDTTESRKLQERLQQAQKMEAIGSLAGGIAHDFNNLLFPIIGLAEILLDDLQPGSFEHDYIQNIYKAGMRGKELVQQILTFSRQSEQKRLPLLIQHVLTDVLKLGRSSIPAYIEIVEEIQQDCAAVMANPTQIHQIAMNLITNAYHAIDPNPGKIVVELQEGELDANNLPGGELESGRYAKLSITDTGTGIDPQLQKKIFDPYVTTKEPGKGTGLGLAVVYGIIRDYKGDIRVYSELGIGTTFCVYIPLMDHIEAPQDVRPIKTYQTGNERVLLVDDDQGVLQLEGQMLERLGYEVTSRNSSVEALNAFKASPDNFDLLVTDMNMPSMTGDRLARAVIDVRSDMPVIICTGFSERINETRARAIGIKGFLMKPVSMGQMADLVRKVLDGVVG